MSQNPNRIRQHSAAKFIFLCSILVIILLASIILNNSFSPSTSNMVSNTIDIDNGDSKINWDRFTYHDITLSEMLNITSSGVYHLTGSLIDQNININVSDGKVKLILDNVSIINSNGPAIVCYAADDLVIELTGDNTLEDGKSYDANYDEDVSGVIYSKGDLTLQGNGTLDITANYLDGIVGKDDLKINSGTYNITTNDDGIRGKDSVYIVDGNFAIDVKADAIKSTNETTVGKGFVLIEKGSFNIIAEAKGIKATNSILIYDGNFNIASTDDSIHTNNYIGIINGNFSINSKDDGIHADKELIIDGGNIDVVRSYEGFEAQAITINNGNISITSNDDGLNAGGGADSSATNRPGAGMFNTDTNCILSINGGNLYINASGDGVDSNGYLYFNGGITIVDGPTNNDNGALDSGIEIIQNGGTVFAIGASGMAEPLGSNSSIYNASIHLPSSQTAGTKIEIEDPTGNTIINHTSAKTFNHIAIGTPDFKFGESYTIYINDEEYTTFTISSTTTTVGSNTNNFNNMPQSGKQSLQQSHR